MTTRNTKAQASKAQASAQSAQAKRTNKRTSAKATNYAVVGTFKRTDNGKTVDSVTIETRFRSQDFAHMTSLAKAHKGTYSRYAQAFLFDSAANAKAFASDINAAVAKGDIVADPNNLATKKARKAAGLPAHTPEWYAAREKAANKPAKQVSPAKATPKAKTSKKSSDMEKQFAMFKQFMAFMQANNA